MAMYRSSLCLGGGRILADSFRHLAIGNPQAKNVYGLPKKPPTPWILFYTSNLPAYRKSNPTMGVAQIMKKISVEWAKVPEAKKSAMKMDFEKERLKWEKLVAAVPEAQMDAVARVKKGEQVAKKIKTVQSELKELLIKTKKPTKPMTGYFLFMEQRRKSLPANVIPSERITKMGTEWKAMTDEQKAPFVKKHAEMKENYEKAMVVWNRKMEKEGKMAEIEAIKARIAELKYVERNPL